MTTPLISDIPPNWKDALDEHATGTNWRTHIGKLGTFLAKERKEEREREEKKRYHPRGKQIFKTFWMTPFNDVHVVIIGQDPYPKKENAMGMSFSVPPNRPIPESLMRIYCAIGIDIGGKIPNNGDLLPWAEQGVLLLNRMLTFCPNVDDKNKNTHIGLLGEDWRKFTEAVVIALVRAPRPIRFLLWGTEAKSIRKNITIEDALVYEAPHPKPVANDELAQEFLTCRHFSEVNRALGEDNEIEWIPPAPARDARR